MAAQLLYSPSGPWDKAAAGYSIPIPSQFPFLGVRMYEPKAAIYPSVITYPLLNASLPANKRCWFRDSGLQRLNYKTLPPVNHIALVY